MKKKVRKFASGGDILTALGAGLAGYGAYKYLTRDKGESKDDDYTRRVKEYGTKGKFPEEKSEEKAAPKREEYKPVGNEGKEGIFKDTPKYKKPEGPAAQDVSGKKSVPTGRTNNATTSTSSQSNQRQGSSTTTGVDAGIAAGKQKKKAESSDKPAAPNLKPGESRSVGEGTSKPPPSEAERRAKKASVAKAEDEKAQKDYALRGPISDAIRRNVRETFPYSDMGDPRGTPGMRARNADRSRAYLKEMADKGRAREAEENAKKQEKDAAQAKEFRERSLQPLKKGGTVKKYASGGSVSSASKRADGCAIRGKTRA